MSKRNRRLLISLIFTLVSLALLKISNDGYISGVKTLSSNQPGYYLVVEVYDGDTFSVNMDGMVEKIRMIGVDTPETHHPNAPVQCFGESASQYTKKILNGSKVRLEADPTNSNRDKYQRLLRYVYLQDGRLLNAEIIKDGYGFAYVHFPFTKMQEFQQFQDLASESGKGLWSGCEVSDSSGRMQTNDAEGR